VRSARRDWVAVQTRGTNIEAAMASQVTTSHGLSWHGRRFTVAIGRHTTTVTLDSGRILPVKTGSTTHDVGSGRTLAVVTRRPDLSHATDAVRCG
jgi:hypothetical protein